MVVLLFLFTIILFFVADYINVRFIKRDRRYITSVVPNHIMYNNSTVGFTMADGGEPFKEEEHVCPHCGKKI